MGSLHLSGARDDSGRNTFENEGIRTAWTITDLKPTPDSKRTLAWESIRYSTPDGSPCKKYFQLVNLK